MSTEYADLTLTGLLSRGPFDCPCGKRHSAGLKRAIVEPGAVSAVPDEVARLGCGRPFVVADENTMAAAGQRVLSALEAAGMPFSRFVFGSERLEPDEAAVGAVALNWDYSCDALVSVGSGVINDLCKIASRQLGVPYIIVGTAPSMDGYASSTSSVVRSGLKVSVDSRCPDVFIGDTDVLAAAPEIMLQAGLGDMIAKYVSVCEWRIGHIATGEYYCEEVARIVRCALKRVTDNAHGLLERDGQAVRAVTEGLIIAGIAADYAGVSRPVSGVEHYYSHLWDMRAVEFGTPWSLHGIQCGIGTRLAAAKYEKLRREDFDRDRAIRVFDAFDREARKRELRDYLGRAGETIVAALDASDRYDRAKHLSRVENLMNNRDEILRIVKEEMPEESEILSLLRSVGAPVSSAEIGIPEEENDRTFRLTMDIRDKYILSTLLFDLGLIER